MLPASTPARPGLAFRRPHGGRFRRPVLVGIRRSPVLPFCAGDGGPGGPSRQPSGDVTTAGRVRHNRACPTWPAQNDTQATFHPSFGGLHAAGCAGVAPHPCRSRAAWRLRADGRPGLRTFTEPLPKIPGRRARRLKRQRVKPEGTEKKKSGGRKITAGPATTISRNRTRPPHPSTPPHARRRPGTAA